MAIEGSYELLESLLGPLTEMAGLRHGFADTISLFSLALARWLPIVALAPFLGGRLVPNAVRVSMAVLFSLWVLPWLSFHAPQPLDYSVWEWSWMSVQEALIGFLLGFSAGLIFWAAEAGGRMIDQVRGTTTANLLIPVSQVQSSLLGTFYYQLFTVLFLLMGGHVWFLGAVVDSYELLTPFSENMVVIGNGPAFIEATARTLAIGMKLIAPGMVVVMFLDIVLGVANRMAPQLQVFFISLSLKASLSSLALALSMYYAVSLASETFDEYRYWLNESFEVLRLEP